ncbi:MAG: hypothetical protein AB2704_21975 [Candidatus Thiodiazotropha taylori]
MRVTILIDIRFNGLLEASAVLIHQERAYVNLNRSTHMNKRLDCEHMQLFDSNLNRYMFCSGMVFLISDGRRLGERRA